MVSGKDPTVTDTLTDSFCTTNPVTAKVFAEATFFADYRNLLPHNQHPALILQSSKDALAPLHVGQYMREHMPKSILEVINANGHCLHMTHPQLVAEKIVAHQQQRCCHVN